MFRWRARASATIAILVSSAHLRRRSGPVSTSARRDRTICGRSAEERRSERQMRIMPLVEALKLWLEANLARVSARSPLAEAIRYGLSHWDGLVHFLDDGRIEIDSNTVERSIRPFALNRKNALFAGSDEGGANWAIIASLIETAKLTGVDIAAKIAAAHHAHGSFRQSVTAFVPTTSVELKSPNRGV